MKAGLYARVSTEDKNQDPETQLYALRQFCKTAGWEVYQEYVDKARAKDYMNRGQWQQLRGMPTSRSLRSFWSSALTGRLGVSGSVSTVCRTGMSGV